MFDGIDALGMVMLITVGVPLGILAFWYFLALLKFLWLLGKSVFDDISDDF